MAGALTPFSSRRIWTPAWASITARSTPDEIEAVGAAEDALGSEPDFNPLLPARPNELIPGGNTWTVQATVYGARTYGDLMNARQTLSFVRLARVIGDARRGGSRRWS